MGIPPNDGWHTCPRGTLRQLAADLSARRARRLLVTRVGWAAGTVLLIAAGWQGATAVQSWYGGGGRGVGHGCSSSSAATCPTTPSTPSSQPAPSSHSAEVAPAGCGAK